MSQGRAACRSALLAIFGFVLVFGFNDVCLLINRDQSRAPFPRNHMAHTPFGVWGITGTAGNHVDVAMPNRLPSDLATVGPNVVSLNG